MKRAPRTQVSALPVWRSREQVQIEADRYGLMEATEHPDSGEWWVRHSYLAPFPVVRNGRRFTEMVHMWTGWRPAKEPVHIDRRWRLQRRHDVHGQMRYRSALLPVHMEIPA